MKAVRVHETGAADVLRYEDVDDPKPGAGEALVKMEIGQSAIAETLVVGSGEGVTPVTPL